LEYFVIGERELVLGFKLVGVKGKAVSNRQEALDSFNKMTGQLSSVNSYAEQDRPKVLILTEDVADMLDEEVQSWQMKGKAPLIVEIPGLQGHIQGRKTLTDSIREAVGIQV
jgi:V/A-type H+-transporting ATPase subunit F